MDVSSELTIFGVFDGVGGDKEGGRNERLSKDVEPRKKAKEGVMRLV